VETEYDEQRIRLEGALDVPKYAKRQWQLSSPAIYDVTNA
jgi:hypothetical protein